MQNAVMQASIKRPHAVFFYSGRIPWPLLYITRSSCRSPASCSVGSMLHRLFKYILLCAFLGLFVFGDGRAQRLSVRHYDMRSGRWNEVGWNSLSSL